MSEGVNEMFDGITFAAEETENGLVPSIILKIGKQSTIFRADCAFETHEMAREFMQAVQSAFRAARLQDWWSEQ